MFILVHSPEGSPIVANTERIELIFRQILVDDTKPKRTETTVTRILFIKLDSSDLGRHIDCIESVEEIEQQIQLHQEVLQFEP